MPLKATKSYQGVPWLDIHLTASFPGPG